MFDAIGRFLAALADVLVRAWMYAEPLLWLATFFFTVRIWARMRSLRRQARTAPLGPPTIVNFSGHPIAASEGGWTQGIPVDGGLVTLRDESPESLDQDVQAMIRALSPALRSRLMVGDPNVIVALPGLAPAAFHLVAHLHGLMGHFPTVTYPLRTGGTYVYVRPVVGQDLRLLARASLRRGE